MSDLILVNNPSPVSAVNGTANQIDATAGPAVTLTLDSALVFPGSATANAGTFSVGQSIAATSGVNRNSQILNIVGNYWTGTTSVADTWTMQNVLNTGTATITATSVTSNLLTVTCANTYKIGNYVYLSGTAETALNGQTVIILSRTSTNFTANLTTGNFTNASDTGTAVIVNPASTLTLSNSGAALTLPLVQVPRLNATSGITITAPSGAVFPLTVTPTGGTGAVTWTYTVQGLDANGYAMSVITASTTTGVATLNGTTFNALTWANTATGTGVPIAASFNIYRTAVGTSPSTKGLIANIAGSSTSYNDIGAAGDGTAVIAHEEGLTLYSYFQDRYNWAGVRLFYDNSGFGGWLFETLASGNGTAGGFAFGASGKIWFVDLSNGGGAWTPGSNNAIDVGRFWTTPPTVANIEIPRYVFAGTALTAQAPTISTSSTTVNSAQVQCSGFYWGTAGAAAIDTWAWQNTLQAGATATITNIVLTSNVLTVTCTNTFAVGDIVVFAGLTTSTFLNGTTATIATVSGSQFTASVTHADVVTHVDTGSASRTNPTTTLTLTHSGSSGTASLSLGTPISKVGAQPTTGALGVAGVVYAATTPNNNTTPGTYSTVFTTSAAGLYRITGALYATTLSSTAWTVEVAAQFTQNGGTGVQSQLVAQQTIGTTNNATTSYLPVTMSLAAGATIGIATITTAGANTSGVYTYSVVIERLA